MLKVSNTITQTATLVDGTWEAVLEAEFMRQDEDGSEPKVISYSVKTYDSDLLRAFTVLEKSRAAYFTEKFKGKTALNWSPDAT